MEWDAGQLISGQLQEREGSWMFVARRALFGVVFMVALGNVVGAKESLVRCSRAELHMGVEFEVVLYAGDAAAGEVAIVKAFARIAELDKALSDYDAESELSQLSESSVVLGEGKKG